MGKFKSEPLKGRWNHRLASTFHLGKGFGSTGVNMVCRGCLPSIVDSGARGRTVDSATEPKAGNQLHHLTLGAHRCEIPWRWKRARSFLTPVVRIRLRLQCRAGQNPWKFAPNARRILTEVTDVPGSRSVLQKRRRPVRRTDRHPAVGPQCLRNFPILGGKRLVFAFRAAIRRGFSNQRTFQCAAFQ